MFCLSWRVACYIQHMTVCSVDDCTKPVKAWGWCGTHYMRWLRTGDPTKVRRVVRTGLTETERFWASVTKTETCWLWTGAKNKGHGQFTVSRTDVRSPKKLMAHRYAYELLVGPIPDGLELDHLCRVRHCVNPAHLEPVTRRENLLRGETHAARNAAKTHCKRGHEFTPENTYYPKGGRGCRTCRTAYMREYAKTHRRTRVRERAASQRRGEGTEQGSRARCLAPGI